MTQATRFATRALPLAAALLAASTSLTIAADWVGRGGVINGGIKDYSNAVPVPSPHPAPVQSVRDWYVRGDVGYNFYAHGEINEYGGVRGFEMDKTAGDAFGGIGFGRYLTPSLRFDITSDFKTKRRLAPTNQRFTEANTSLLGVPANFDVAHTENAFTTNYSGMINLYYDFARHGAFRPYIGAGVGAGYNRIERTFDQTATCRDFDDDNNPLTPNVACGGSVTATGRGLTSSIGFAAAVMAGFAVDIAPGVKLDSGYRFLWSGTDAAITFDNALGSKNRLGTEDRFDHEIRTGLRLDLTP